MPSMLSCLTLMTSRSSEIEKTQATDAAALEKLQDAFYLDPQEINSREHCKHIDA